MESERADNSGVVCPPIQGGADAWRHSQPAEEALTAPLHVVVCDSAYVASCIGFWRD